MWLTFLLLHALWLNMPHPIHLSVAEIYQNKDTRKLELSITLFMDDFSKAVNYASYEKQIRQGKIKPEDLMIRYLREKLELKLNGQAVAFELLRTESAMDAVTCYLQLKPQVAEVHKIEVRNQVFLELFDDQRNMVQVRLPGEKGGAMLLNKEKPSASAAF